MIENFNDVTEERLLNERSITQNDDADQEVSKEERGDQPHHITTEADELMNHIK